MLQLRYNSVVMRNYVFDLYNTLIDVETDEHREKTWLGVTEYFEGRGIKATPSDLMREFDGYWAVFEAKKSEFDFPECDCVEQFMCMAERLGGRLTREEAREALIMMRRASVKHMRLFDGTVELLNELHSRGKRVYLLSNAQAAFTRAEIAEMGLNDKFDGILLSSDCGCRKPDKRFFGMLFDKYGLDKTESVMIGDDLNSDGQGAAHFGIPFIHAAGGAAAHKDEILKLGDYE